MRRVTVTATTLLSVIALALTVVAGTATPAVAQSVLERGDRGDTVARWQEQLNAVRGDDIAVDGVYGPVTEQATVAFQQSAGITVDGLVGPETRSAMEQALAGDVGGADPVPDQGRDTSGLPGGVLRPGASGESVAAIQRHLAGMTYWVGPIDGVYGDLTRQAVLAFQKVNGLTRDGIYGPSTRAAMTSPQPPTTWSDDGLVVEVDEATQVVRYVRDGEVQHVWNASTGTGEPYTSGGERYIAETPDGHWEVYRQVDGWRESHLGRLYRPKYFHTDGIAIHGHPEVPAHPASHGCVRISMAGMDFLWGILPIGTPVWVS